jgi:hypothetical protein
MKRVLALLLLLPTLASAGLELGVGITHATHADNGTWYQEEFGHHLMMNSPSLSIGWKSIAKENILGFERVYVRGGYEYLGRFRSDALATASDQNYGACRYTITNCWPLSHWHGSGVVQGMYATVQPEIDMSGYSIFFEGGASLYRASWKVDIPDWRPAEAGPVQSLTALHATRWQSTYVVGLGVRKGPVGLSYTLRKAEATGDLFPAIYCHTASNLSLRYSF